MSVAEARAALEILRKERFSVKEEIIKHENTLKLLHNKLINLQGMQGYGGAIYDAELELERQMRIEEDVKNFPVRFNTMKRELYSNEKSHTQLIFLKETPKSYKYREIGSDKERVIKKNPGQFDFPFCSDVSEFFDWIETNFGKGK